MIEATITHIEYVKRVSEHKRDLLITNNLEEANRYAKDTDGMVTKNYKTNEYWVWPKNDGVFQATLPMGED